MTIRKIFIILSILNSSTLFGQKKDTPDYVTVKGIKPEYFWNNDRDAKSLKNGKTVLLDSIKNGYYSKKEYLTFVDKKLISIKFKKDDSLTEIKLPNGNGIICSNKDTLRLVNGKLNGESYFYSYYPVDPLPQAGTTNLSKELEKAVYIFKDNFLISVLIYRKGILIYESYYKKYDFVKESRGRAHNTGLYLDSVLNIYNANGNLRSSTKYKNGRPIK